MSLQFKKNFLCNLASRIVFWVSLIVFDENKTSFPNEFLIVLTIHSKKQNAYLFLVKILLLWSMSNHSVNIRAQWMWEQTCWINFFSNHAFFPNMQESFLTPNIYFRWEWLQSDNSATSSGHNNMGTSKSSSCSWYASYVIVDKIA